MEYNTYHFKGRERWKYRIQGCLLTTVFAIIFYRSLLAVIVFLPISQLYIKSMEKKRCRERKWKFNQDFKQAIAAVSAALNAGYSIENSFHEACRDLSLLYESDTDIMQEFTWISKQIAMNETVESLLGDLAERTQIEDVESFVEIFQTAKRTGGNLMKIIQRTADNIGERMEIQRELQTLIAQKKLEANIMSIVPLGIILYLWISSPGFLDVLYHNGMGVAFMTAILLAYVGAYCLMQRIMRIEL